MKHAKFVIAASSVAALAFSPALQARGLRADIQCPYGNGGIEWTPTAGNPLNINTGVSGAYTSLFVPTNPASISQDDVGLNVTSASQYNTYAAVPDASTCGSNPNAPTPAAQVMVYVLGSGNSIGSVGDNEVEFNYGFGVSSGAASFTIAGVTFSASALNSGVESDFLFSSSGQFLGSIRGDFGSAILADSLPGGWSINSTGGGGGGGTVSAPELDASTGAGALALLAAGIALLRGRRRI